MVFEKLFERMRAKRDIVNDAETDLRVGQLVQQKQKTSNERELERFNEEERQEMITKMLAQKRKQRLSEMFSTNMLNSPNVFNHKNTVMDGDATILKGKSMFMGKGSFMSKGNIFQGGMN